MNQLTITGLGTYLPRNTGDNARLTPLEPPRSVEEMDAIGVLRRGHADETETESMMAIAAGQRALEQAAIEPAQISFVIFVNWTARRYVPDLAPRIQHAVGARNAVAFDLCCACCGFIQALSVAHGYLQQARFGAGLVLTADRSASHMRPKTRATLVFGDGASAAVVQSGAHPGIRLLDYEVRTDGSQNGIMEIDADGYLLPHIRQRELNALAGKRMAEVSLALLERNRLTLDEIRWIVPHSGTAGVQTTLREYLKAAPERVLTTLPFQGNLASSAIPCSLRHFLDSGHLVPGQRILAAAVGLGWQYAAMLLEIQA